MQRQTRFLFNDFLFSARVKVIQTCPKCRPDVYSNRLVIRVKIVLESGKRRVYTRFY